MKRVNFVFKYVVLVLFLACLVSSCLKSNDTSSSNTAETEAALIKTWKAKMKSTNIAYDSTATKIFYIIDKTKVGTGPNVTTGKTVTVKYTGTFMDGSIFDSSENFTYVHKSSSQRLISGWEEGIELLNKGAKATFLFPSSLAYGNYGYSSIPGYTPLFFVIEVVDIK
jgi:peptidylprolyl isomerase/FKBP-type peptidyl-prolyl cis-trans isomerase FkpA